MATDPRVEFGRQLDLVRVTAGSPTLNKLAGYRSEEPDLWGRTQMAKILAGSFDRVPEWDRVRAFLRACLRHAGNDVIRQLRTLADETVWRTRHAALVEVLQTLAAATSVPPSTECATWVRVGAPPMLADQYQSRSSLADRFVGTLARAGTVVLTQVLSGTGGVGKTQLAAAFASREWADRGIQLAMWVSARSRDGIIAAYSQAAVELLYADPGEPEQAAARLLAWMASTDQRWLIVLDDLQRPEDLRQLWPPTNVGGRVVVTTRRRDPSLARVDRAFVEVGVFVPEEAHKYLQAKLVDYPHLVDGSEELANDLGYLPLALAQAVAYLINRNLTCQQYRARLADQRRRLCQVLPEAGELPDDHDKTVAATFALSVDLADTLVPVGMARPVMLLVSLLDPTGIPAILFTAQAVLNYLDGVLGRSVDAEDVRDALWLLHRLNLLTVDVAVPRRGVRAHGLVQRATREVIAEQDSTAFADGAWGAADALVEVWPDIERDNALAQALRANALSLQAVAGDALWSPDGHPVLFRVGGSLGEVGLVASAVSHFDDLHTAALRYLGPDHPDILVVRSNAAIWHGEAGDSAGAADAYADVLSAMLRIHGPEHPTVLVTRNNAALWRGRAGDLDGAADAFVNLLEDGRRVLGPDHPSVLVIRANLASVRGDAGDLAGATDAYTELLEDQRRVLGHDHPNILVTRAHLADLRGRAGDPAGAANAYADILEDRLRIFGPDHPETLATRNNLALWRGEAGDPASAADAYTELLEDQQRVLGHDHPKALVSRLHLANMYGEMGDLAGATDAYTELLEDEQRVLGHDHPNILVTRAHLADLRGRAGDPAGAANIYADLLNTMLRVLGPDHPDVLVARNNLALWRGHAGDLAGAIDAFAKLLADRIQTLGQDHPETLVARAHLADLRGRAGDATGAADAFTELFIDRLRVLGADHPNTLATRAHLALWCGKAGDPAGAASAFSELLVDRLRVLGPEHPDTKATAQHLARWRAQAKG